jgi:hypothetical protein
MRNRKTQCKSFQKLSCVAKTCSKVSCTSISEQHTVSLLKILHSYQNALCHNSLRTHCTLQVMKTIKSIRFLTKFVFLVGIDWFIFWLLYYTVIILHCYYTTLFPVEILSPIARNERGSNDEQYARK